MNKSELYRVIQLIVFVCFVGSGIGLAQSISTGALTSSNFCAGDAISVPISLSGTFGPNNTFNVQLSDATGSFGSPVVIGVLTDNTAATAISAVIPQDLPSGTAYRVRVVSNTPTPGITGSTSPTIMTINPRPSAPSAIAITPGPNVCSGQSLTLSSASSGATIRWIVGGTQVGTGSPFVYANIQTTTTFIAEAFIGSCTSSVNTLVTVTATPPNPVVAPQSQCQGATPITLQPSGSQYRWYTMAGVLLSNNGAAPTPPTNTSGTTSYQVERISGDCASGRVTVTHTVVAAPAKLDDISLTYCEANRPTAFSVTGSDLVWYADAAATITIASPTPPALARATPYVYYVRQFGLNGCGSVPAQISVKVNASPAPPVITSNLIVCQNTTAQPLAATGQSLTWYDASNNQLPGAPTPPTTTTGSLTYYVTQTSTEGCISSRTTVVVSINSVPVLPTAPAAGTYCQGATAALLTATGQNLRWYGTNANGGTSSTVAPRPGTTDAGTTNYYVTQTVNGCESARLAIPVTVKTTPGAPMTTETTFCQNYPAPTLTATSVSSAVLSWYTSASGGPSSTTAPTPPNTIGNVIYTYYVSQTLDGCESPRGSINVRVKPTPIAPGVTSVSLCNNAPSQPLVASGANLRWFDPSGNLVAGSPAPPTTTVGTFNYQVTQSLDGCESRTATLSVTVLPLPSAPSVASITYCQSQPDQAPQNIVPLSANGQNLRWYNADGNQFIAPPTPPIDQIQTINYLVTQTVNGCESLKATLKVTIQTTPVPGTPIPAVTYCRNDVAVPLTAVAASGASLRWIDPNGNRTNEAPTPITLNATPPGGRLFYVYQIGSNGCASARASIKLVVNTNPTLSLLGSTTVNLGISTPLQLQFTGAPPFSYTLSDGTSGTAKDTLATVNVKPAQTTVFQVTSVSNVCGIGLPGNPATATVFVKIPTISTGSLTTTTLCAGLSFSVPFITTGEFNPGNAFKVQLADSTTKNYIDISAASTIGPIVATIPANQAGGVYFVRVIGTNPTIPVLGLRSPTVLYVRPFPTASITGAQSIYEGSPGSLSISFTGDGPWTFVYNDSLRNITVQTNANPHRLDIRPLKTTTYKLLSVSNNCGTGTVSGTAITVQVLPLLGVEDDLLGTLVKAYPIPTTSGVTVDIDLPLQRNPAVIQLTDLNGRTITQKTSRESRTTVDLSQQPAGIYLLKVQVGDRKTFRRVLKQ